jgi:hypothetical protein
MDIIDQVEGLYRIIPLKLLRRTEGVSFDVIPQNLIPKIDAVDRVIHENGAISPGTIESVERPWYMHTHQDDNLIVLHGIRYVDIYTPSHGKVESFECAPHHIKKNGKVIHDGPGMLVWPVGVFHRVKSCEKDGSASVNLATHYKSFDIRTNFSIYDLNTETGEYKVIREGHEDQFM